MPLNSLLHFLIVLISILQPSLIPVCKREQYSRDKRRPAAIIHAPLGERLKHLHAPLAPVPACSITNGRTPTLGAPGRSGCTALEVAASPLPCTSLYRRSPLPQDTKRRSGLPPWLAPSRTATDGSKAGSSAGPAASEGPGAWRPAGSRAGVRAPYYALEQ